jgi:hypothetical protein
MPLGALVAGALLEWLPAETATLSLTAMMGAVALVATLSPAVRHAPPLPEPTPARQAEPVPA